MKQVIILSFFLFLIFGISNVYSQEFDNALSIVISEDEPIIIGSQGEYSVDPDDMGQVITFTFNEPFTGTYNLKLPKSIPSLAQLVSGEEHPSEKFFLENDDTEFEAEYNETDCFFNYNMVVYNVTRIDIISTLVLMGETITIDNDFEPYCSDIFESLKQVKVFKTCDNFHSPQFNNRVDQVCVYPESVSKLTDRGYLI